MTSGIRYTVTFTLAARRRLDKPDRSTRLAKALGEPGIRPLRALIGPVADNPHRLGKPLEAPYDETRSTCWREYRALYTVDEHKHVITILAVAHRRDAYRPR